MVREGEEREKLDGFSNLDVLLVDANDPWIHAAGNLSLGKEGVAGDNDDVADMNEVGCGPIDADHP